MKKDAAYLTKKFGSPVIGDSMILYKKVIQTSTGQLVSQWNRRYKYHIGKVAVPTRSPDPASYGVCGSGVHVGSMKFAKDFNYTCPYGREKYVILACQVKVADMIADQSDGKVRCKAILPLGIVQE